MTLFTTLLVLIAERLFKLGEHWQLDHRLEVLFRRMKHYSISATVLMTLVAMVVVFLLQRVLHGVLFNVPLMVVWILIGLLCIGAGKVRIHYHAYLMAASRDDSRAREAMASELTLIHGVPPGCDEREYLRELQNALLWINYRFYLAPLFWFVVGGPWGPVTLMGYAFLRRLADVACALPDATASPGVGRGRDFTYSGLGPGAAGRRGVCPDRPWRKSAAGLVCFAWRSPQLPVSGTDAAGAVLTCPRAARQ